MRNSGADSITSLTASTAHGLVHNDFWGHVMSSVTWPFDSRGSTSYRWFIVTMRLSSSVMEIWRLKDNGVTSLTFSGLMTSRDHSTPGGCLFMGGP